MRAECERKQDVKKKAVTSCNACTSRISQSALQDLLQVSSKDKQTLAQPAFPSISSRFEKRLNPKQNLKTFPTFSLQNKKTLSR